MHERRDDERSEHERGLAPRPAGESRPDAGSDAAHRGLSSSEALARWAPQIERYLRRRAHHAVLARESAADLAQSVCREALERLQRGALEYRGEAELKQWLYGAADLKVKNRLRFYGAAKRADEVHGAVGAEATAPALGPTPSADYANAESRATFERALGALDERTERAVRMFHLEGRDHAEVARALGVSDSHSRTLVARGLARLARLLREAPPGG
ncbi:MAG: sigma-70 family RNA polymerase sigma factor [Planctomycetota bacterium]